MPKESEMTNVVKIEPIQQSIMTVRIKSLSPFIQHKWSEKALQMMKDKHAGLRVKNRDVRDPHQEFLDATYRCEDGRYGFPAGGIKAALIGAAYRPEFQEWAMTLQLEFDSQALSQENILNLIERAGFGVGLGEWRPEKGGEYGRFSVDREFAIETLRFEQVA